MPKKSLSQELMEEESEEKFWEEVETRAKQEVYEVLSGNIPLQNVKLIEEGWQVGGVKKVEEVSKKVGFFPEKDTDFRTILRNDIPDYLYDNEEFQAKIESGKWDIEDVKYAAQLAAFHYLVAVIKGIDRRLQAYESYDSSYLEGVGE